MTILLSCILITTMAIYAYNIWHYSDLCQLGLIKSNKNISLKRINEALSNINNDADLKQKSP